jgi:small conductance mechanosensitive channel
MDSQSLHSLYLTIQDLAVAYGGRVLGAIAILIVGRIAAGIVSKGVRRGMNRAKVDAALGSFVSKLAFFGMWVFALIASLEAFGVKTTSFVAVLGAAGLAVGLALQGSLSNFAAGVMILIFRPFRIGDFIEAAGVRGKVVEISVFTTILHTPDNQKMIVPNSGIMGGNIINVTAMDTRRVDLTAGIAYDDDIDTAKRVFLELCTNHPKVLKDPAPVVKLASLGDSSVNFSIRPWTKTDDYWDVFFDLNEQIKKACDANGLSIPFPQRDVHLFQSSN